MIVVLFLLIFFKVYLFFERERVGEGQRGRERENPKQTLCYQPQNRAQTHEPGDHDLS